MHITDLAPLLSAMLSIDCICIIRNRLRWNLIPLKSKSLFLKKAYTLSLKRNHRYLQHCFRHDENNVANIGDFVSVKECKPFSKTKTWILEESDSIGGDS